MLSSWGDTQAASFRYIETAKEILRCAAKSDYRLPTTQEMYPTASEAGRSGLGLFTTVNQGALMLLREQHCAFERSNSTLHALL
jgi:hypothetical protein